MLHMETVERETFTLLVELMQDQSMNGFKLAGETALALYLGHRKSIDLDLFTPYDFDSNNLEEYLIDKYDFNTTFLDLNTTKGTINDVKVDFIRFDYIDQGSPFISNEGVRLYNMIDIAAMKLSAISGNGTRIKDFIDIAYLSSKFSLTEMLNAYQKKFPNSNKIIPFKGLTYFNDIDFNEPVQVFDASYKWDKVEKRLHEMSLKTNTVFPKLEIMSYND